MHAGSTTGQAPVRATAPRTAAGPGRAEAALLLPEIGRDPLSAALGLYRRYGDLVRVPLLPRHTLFLMCHPAHAEHVLVSNEANYRKAATYRPLRVFLGDGLVTSEGALWERQRRLIQPIFSHRRVSGFLPGMTAQVRGTLDGWDLLPDGALVHVSETMSRLTLNIVGEALFGADLRGAGERVSAAVTGMQDFATTAMRNPLLLPAPRLGLRTTPGYRTWRGTVEAIDAVVEQVAAERRAGGGPAGERHDLMDALLEARYEDGSAISPGQLRDEIVTFLMAGHETSATVLTWTCHLLAAHPAARRRLEEEVDGVLGGREPELADVDRLVWTKAVLSEAMRLYPPFWTLERSAVEDDEIDGVPVPAGSTVAVPPYLVHRHPAAWDNPEGFDPSRFLPGAGEGRPKHAFIPFGSGRRGCVGNVFALLETVAAVAMLAQRFRLDLAPGGVPRVQPTVTLRPRGGLRMVLRRR
ncbi:cytochrome P450 [Streptomyces armeniacus]|uniref:Cytochrome P450 n=1 Tax=Streptomyces armeniacus TaxID=83291 RepID=A0A345XT93_9ACTN|nr:cytochrome P450 [Streptomyces armeniacus]AXK34859.1 cytochrome P450 [Streptomyces armeniacus]